MDDDTKTYPLILQERYLIAALGTKKIAFAANLVRDILMIERSQIWRGEQFLIFNPNSFLLV